MRAGLYMDAGNLAKFGATKTRARGPRVCVCNDCHCCFVRRLKASKKG